MHPRTILSIGNFFFSLFCGLVMLILLPYLSLFMPAAYTGFVVAGSSALAFVLFPLLPKIVDRYGARKLALAFALIEVAVLFALAAAPGLVASLFLVAITIMVQPFLAYELDLLMEATSNETSTVGRTRALFRTAWSAAALAAPLLLGVLLVSSDSYYRVFIAAAAALAPLVIFFNANRLPRGPSPKLVATKNSLRHILRNRDLAAVIAGNFFLYLFLAWAPLYAPLYLHGVVGIAWSSLGWMFAVMLLPYSLLEYPASWLADRYLGDKELMAVGFLVAGGGLAALAFVTPSTSLVNILIILVVSRAGAALIEAMVDAHFFRRVSRRDINSVGIFRATWPLSFAVAPAIGSLLLLCGGYPALFLFTGACVTIGGTVCAILIKDFK